LQLKKIGENENISKHTITYIFGEREMAERGDKILPKVSAKFHIFTNTAT